MDVHANIKCDGCNMVPIVGNRYNCSECKNFDFCEHCLNYRYHDNTHKFVKRSMIPTKSPKYTFPTTNMDISSSGRLLTRMDIYSSGR